MKAPWLALALTMTSCTPDPKIVTTGPIADGPVWLVGVAGNAKLGPIVMMPDGAIYCEGMPAWPADRLGHPVVVAGTMAAHEEPAPPVGPKGEQSAGASGKRKVLAACAVPPATDDGLLDAERALFGALRTKDRATLESLVAGSFVMRLPGQPDLERDAFLRAATGVPVEVLGIEGDGMTAHRSGDTGVVRGIQVAHVREQGQTIDDRGAFVDVFTKKDGRWLLVFALVVPISG